jgi:hypothetical protein
MELTLENAVKLLRDMIIQADEDTPSEYRTDHFRTAMEDGIEFVLEYDKQKKVS